MNDATPKLRLMSASARNAPNFRPGFSAVMSVFPANSPVTTSPKLWSAPPVKKNPPIAMSRYSENNTNATPTASLVRTSLNHRFSPLSVDFLLLILLIIYAMF